jgi:hypothetical protein
MEELINGISNASSIQELTDVFKNNKVEDFLMCFFHNHLDLHTKLSTSEGEKFANKIFFKTFCYILGSQDLGIESLKKCLGKASREKIAWEMISLNESEENITLGEIDNSEEAFLNHMRESWIRLNTLNDYYLEFLSRKINNGDKISKILVYEAPPFCETNCLEHFFISEGLYSNVICHATKSNNQIKGLEKNELRCENFLNPYRIKLSKSIKAKLTLDESNCNQKYLEITEDSVKILNEQIPLQIEKIINSDIVYVDLTLLSLPLNRDLRKEWSTEERYLFGEKKIELPVLMFQLTIKHLTNKLIEFGAKDIFDKNCLIALGTPLNTSASIFEYYVDDNFEISKDNLTDVSRLNSPTAFKKTKNKGTTFPMFKSNVIGGSGWPEKELIINAFNLPK